MAVDFSKIKLVIWDLDETFWTGVLSDHTAVFSEENADLIRNMTDAGVISAICSKNDEQDVQALMTEHGVWDLFVFNSINWTPKGERVAQIIREMNLRAPNVLFIDDNDTNLGEVAMACEGIMCANVDVLPELRTYFQNAPKTDTAHKRLNQYKVLEKKTAFKAQAGSNLEFLRRCHICVQIREDCAEHAERIHDLILRSNQLNFTKVRSTLEELEALWQNPAVRCGCVEVHDRFGDYGIVGFFAIEDGKLLHFTFSCRTLNMGVEQYVYHKIGRPALEIVGDVSSSLDVDCPDWIEEGDGEGLAAKAELVGKKIVIKGPCDLEQAFSFIKDSPNIIREFTYVAPSGVSIEQGNHSAHIVQGLTMDRAAKDRLWKAVPFGDAAMYDTHLFDEDVGFAVYSTFTDPNLGVYREKATGLLVAFGEYTNDLTDESRQDEYIRGDVFVAGCRFTEENLADFRRDFEFYGRLEPDEIVANLKTIREHLPKQTTLVLILGSEIPYPHNQQLAYEDRYLFHQKLNRQIREWAEGDERIYLLDVNRYLTGTDKFTNNINHFTKEVYYEISQELISLMKESGNEEMQTATAFDQKIKKLKRIKNRLTRLKNKLFYRG